MVSLRSARLETWSRPHCEGDSLLKVKGKGMGSAKVLRQLA